LQIQFHDQPLFSSRLLPAKKKHQFPYIPSHTPLLYNKQEKKNGACPELAFYFANILNLAVDIS
jgi:hypothetical protein